ncbi:MAG: ATP-dependent endonuclease [Candidatus Dormibacteraeota bacterium]|nr:ATP-dependent endonuclease [Candidatus Dormibacteraeota bacterium]
MKELPRTVVLVEGVSDQRAVEALARRRGRNLDAERVSIVSMGGATNLGHFLRRLATPTGDVRLAGLCDAGEEGSFRRSLERAGLGSSLTRSDMERLGFYVCVADLEDELIRAVGVPGVERVIDSAGELELFRKFQKQPAWRGRPGTEQLHRFLGTHSGRKIQTAALLVDALDLDRVPRPLDGVLARV